MPSELLESVRGFLKQYVVDNADQHTGFMARVAANSLGIAQREMLYGPALADAERERLHSLLDCQAGLDQLRRELVLRLRDGLELNTPGLAAHLRRTVAGQLALDQPRYSALAQCD
jgi:hypothetical protein